MQGKLSGTFPEKKLETICKIVLIGKLGITCRDVAVSLIIIHTYLWQSCNLMLQIPQCSASTFYKECYFNQIFPH